MTNRRDDLRRGDLQQAFARDFERHARRERGHGSFWRSLSLLGSVGWPIVLLTAGGAVVGHWLDRRWDTGIRFALLLLMLGVGLGIGIAWHLIRTRE